MHSFLYGILGGLVIGLSAAVLLLFTGELLGASSIVASVFLSPKASLQRPDDHWKLVLLSSFCLTSNLFFASGYQDVDGVLATLSPWAFLLGGSMVGFGTKLGSGCTSGHGICGLARFSIRSFASVCVFIGVGVLTAYLTQAETTPFSKDPFSFLRNDEPTELRYFPKLAAAVLVLLNLAALMAPTFHDNTQSQVSLNNSRKKMAPAAVSGALFSAGLYVSRMVFPTYVFGFLNLGLLERGGNNWDPTLMFVMGGGVIVSALSYQLIDGHSWILGSNKTLAKPILLSEGSKFSIPVNTIIDKELIVGALFFGLGWGITGLCPGPAIFLASIGVDWLLVCYWPTFLAGAFVASQIQKRRLFGITPPACDAAQCSENIPSSEDMQCSKKTCQDMTENRVDDEKGAAEVTPPEMLEVGNA